MKMKRAIIIAVLASLGIAAGYLVAPFVSEGYVTTREPDLTGGFFLFLVDSMISCGCENQPPSESAKEVAKEISDLQGWRKPNPRSHLLGLEIGLAEVRLSRLERKLGENAQADNDMKRGQVELTGLGWKNTAPEHLTAVVTQLDSGYQRTGQRSNTVAAAR